jgi:hypothetical protein
MTWSRPMETRLLTLITCLVGALPGCIVPIVDDTAENMDDDTSSGDGDGEAGDGDTGDGDGEPGDGDTGDGDTGDGDEGDGDGDGDGDHGGDGDSGDGDEGDGDGDGDECGPYPSTEVMDCFGLVGQGFCSEGGGHVEIGTEIEWMNEPPHSGKHFPVWSSWGEKIEPVERGYWVHNLEHGGIVFVYNCPSGCEAELDMLREVMDLRPDNKILMTPDPLLGGSRFAALAWTWVYAFDEPMTERLLCFIDQHYDHAPESVL